MSKKRAIADAIQIHRRRDGNSELLVNANLLFFQGAAGTSVSSNLPFQRPRQNREARQARYYI